MNVASNAAVQCSEASGSIVRRAAIGPEPVVFTEIFRDDTNIAIWQRTLPDSLTQPVKSFIQARPSFRTAMTVSPNSARSSIGEALGDATQHALADNIAELVDMFCCLFELNRTGLRLAVLDGPMCPRFHADKVPCRLLTTFQGVATEWLPHDKVNRGQLGSRNQGNTSSPSGLYQSKDDIQRLNCGEVALLKGERWEGNENAGLVHRSPAVTTGEKRLFLTLDFSS